MTVLIIFRNGYFVLFLVLLLLPAFCAPREQQQYKQDERACYIGTYGVFEVIDGDTFRIPGLDRRVRLLCIDTEEVPRGANAAEEVARLREQWPAPYWERLGKGRFPVRPPTPFGYETSQWAKDWFSDVDSIRLERESPEHVYGYFGRLLAYLFARKSGQWMHYNIECVRLGYSPYSMKYGFSERFHSEFEQAQNEARRAGRGIWNSDKQHLPQYDQRLAWWMQRGDAIRTLFKLRAREQEVYFIGRDGEYERMSLAAGKTVLAFGSVGRLSRKGEIRTIILPHKKSIHVRVILPRDTDSGYIRMFEQQYLFFRGRVVLDGDELQIHPSSIRDISASP
ncbi:MAG: thermonuclease family protein [Bacteroidetes bacterium]|nr:thermonuclease family protein [Bacteroidota bacterium]